MKKTMMIAIFLLSLVFMAGAQEIMTSHKNLGNKVAYDVTLTNDTVAFTPQYSITSYDMVVDTTVYLQAVVTKADPGNMLYFKITADATKRYVYFDTNFTGVAAIDSLNISKTRLWGFTFIDGKFVQINRSAEY